MCLLQLIVRKFVTRLAIIELLCSFVLLLRTISVALVSTKVVYLVTHERSVNVQTLGIFNSSKTFFVCGIITAKTEESRLQHFSGYSGVSVTKTFHFF